jgi:hypothetical protein
VSLSEQAQERLRDVVELQPTKNGELQERWGMDSGSEVHQYLESELKQYYFRDENSLIRATTEAAELLGIETDGETVRVPELQVRIAEVLAGPEETPQSVVGVLHDVEDAGLETDVDAVRSGLRSLQDKGIVEVFQETVPTFRLTRAREDLDVAPLDDD